MNVKNIALTQIILCIVLFTASLTAGGTVFSDESGGSTAYGDWTYETKEDGSLRIDAWTGDASVLTVPSEINGYRVTEIGTEIFKDNHYLYKVTVSEGIVTVGERAFSFCESLKEIELPSTLTEISPGAFWQSNVLSIKISPDNIRYMVNDGCILTSDGRELNFMLESSDSERKIPDSVEIIQDFAVSHLDTMSSLYIPSSVKTVGNHAINSCFSLKEIVFEDMNARIAFGNDAFLGLNRLTSLNIPRNSVMLGNNSFMYCSEMTEVTLPKTIAFDSGSFNNCTSLKKVIIPRNSAVSGSCPVLEGVDFWIHGGDNYSAALSSNKVVEYAEIFDNGNARLTVPLNTAAPKPDDPPGITKNWYCDEDLKTPYEWNIPVTEDLFLFSEEIPKKMTVTIFSENRELKYIYTDYGKPAVLPLDSYPYMVFFYTDSAFTNPYDWWEPVTEDIVLYAKMENPPTTPTDDIKDNLSVHNMLFPIILLGLIFLVFGILLKMQSVAFVSDAV
jgi:hypothetical protein